MVRSASKTSFFASIKLIHPVSDGAFTHTPNGVLQLLASEDFVVSVVRVWSLRSLTEAHFCHPKGIQGNLGTANPPTRIELAGKIAFRQRKKLVLRRLRLSPPSFAQHPVAGDFVTNHGRVKKSELPKPWKEP